jgi:hypothetical protein
MHTDREESGEEIEMQENIEEWPFSIHHSFLYFIFVNCAKMLNVSSGNQEYLIPKKNNDYSDIDTIDRHWYEIQK